MKPLFCAFTSCLVFARNRFSNLQRWARQEEFLRYLTEQAHNVAKSDAKPRRNIAYKDIGKPLVP